MMWRELGVEQDTQVGCNEIDLVCPSERDMASWLPPPVEK
jgi:hypothetical protein